MLGIGVWTALPLLTPNAAAPEESLFHRYPPPFEAKEWLNAPAPILWGDFFWQPLLLSFVPDPEQNLPSYGKKLHELDAKFRDRGLVSCIALDLPKGKAAPLVESLTIRLPIAMNAKATFQKYRIKKVPMMFLIGLMGTVVWEGNLDVARDALDSAVERELRDALPLFVKPEIDPKLANAGLFLSRKRFRDFHAETARFAKQKKKDKILAADLLYFETVAKRHVDDVVRTAKELAVRTGFPEALVLVGETLRRMPVENMEWIYPLFDLQTEWELHSPDRKHFALAVDFLGAEADIKEGKLKAALSRLKEIANSPDGVRSYIGTRAKARAEEIEEWLK